MSGETAAALVLIVLVSLSVGLSLLLVNGWRVRREIRSWEAHWRG